ncbi:unnamed protein product [Didymodactylos carnosus]|uniref:B box-type domain-containing protein n=1 Tax=Didymodactylos carnosus TaxID=1234261 RepID=A0A813T584_9BILA|nr:unnamed protein product [Didymodactylos carnosus]CAF0909705.1 unnamed protein product [Didymodactylos carnosus]CAF3589653.1 unnamed protein product [Didymodactylos carnosus]CAF3688959.1 unnamed protein product [Didymodactylos carnosus]
MAATSKVQCAKCEKNSGILTCDGCLEKLCRRCFNDHRQDLSKELDNVVYEHDMLKQQLETPYENDSHRLLKQIDTWKKDSIDKINHLAGQCQSEVVKLLDKNKDRLTDRFVKITNRVRKGRDDEDYDERDLSKWMNELKEIEDELIEPSNFRVEEDKQQSSWIQKIRVHEDFRDQAKATDGYSNLQFSPLSPVKPPTVGTQLKTSSVSGTYLTTLSKEEHKIIEKLSSHDTRILNVGSGSISAEGAKVIAEALKTNQTLTHLYMENNNISDAGAKAIAEALKTNQTLTHLYMENNNISDAGAKAIAEALKTNQTLTVLGIQNNNISDAGAKVIAEALKTNQTLTHLYMSNNNISDAGAKAIAEALKTNQTLTHLYMSNNNISDAGAKVIAKAVKKYKVCAVYH